MAEYQDTHQADTYLRSGSNELKILEFQIGEEIYGINILKVSRVLSEMPSFTIMPDSHPAVRGCFNDHGRVVPVMDLGQFLCGQPTSLEGPYRVIVTEFFSMLNAFLLSSVNTVHTVMWEQVMDAKSAITVGNNPYVISIVQPTEDKMLLMLDYETIIMKLIPDQVGEQLETPEKQSIEGRGRKVLIAEDSTSVRDMLQLEMEEHGFQVLIARDGKEGLALAMQNPDLSLVITDVEMPQMDGLALTKKIKENAETQNVPIIVYSSIGDMGMKERARYLKAEEHITKLNLDELWEKTGKLLL
jgi:two-component system, chemotaxis family, chemotaxis protein CheV